MSQEPPRGSDPGEDPGTQSGADRVSRLLHQVGSERPGLPPDVAARLEGTLAGLVRERSEHDQGGRSTSDGGGGHPRRGRLLLVAATLVLVAGAGGVTLATVTGRSQDTTASRAGGTAADTGPGAPEASLPLGGKAQEGATALPPDGVPVVRPDHVAADVRALVRQDARRGQARRDRAPVPMLGCTVPPGARPGQVRTVLYDGAVASLVLHPPQAGRRLVEVWTCSAGDRLVRIRIAARR